MSIVGSTPVATLQWLMERFQPISLGQLNARAEMLRRRDNKYVVRKDVLEQVLVGLASHFDILEIDGRRVFTYETCYFDDIERTNYFDHHRHRRQRCKVRIRRYTDADLCFVEVKLKGKRDATIKRRLVYSSSKYGVLDESARAYIRASYQGLYGRAFDRALEPVIHMQYQRMTLVAKHDHERMTIDCALVFKGPSGTRGVDEDVFIVETKSANGNGIADKVLRAFHQHPTRRCSKYCVAMAALRQVAKHNNFLVALRKLDVVPSPVAGHGAAENGVIRPNAPAIVPTVASPTDINFALKRT
ncbi:polyphosphate polymerase domain-containing protein [uncultured Castellaniella sp.]|uniref:polyphosphate polymerase domain-containing protein n=1 Tax=uncultured Castellaniella sp. TaxID=647907 RepID=UPI0026187DD3|nr:polyphosphate polymerase domain-containing protein [uncultured Castellaniella sp.]